MSYAYVVMVREKADNNPDNVGVDTVFSDPVEAKNYCDSCNNLFGENLHWVVTSRLKSRSQGLGKSYSV